MLARITEPKHAFDFFRPRLNVPVEEFWVATLDAEKMVTGARCLFRGTVDHCLFHPRDVFRFAVDRNASAIVVAHNHPSGQLDPSAEDEAVTGQLLMAALIMEIPLVDHLIVSPRGYFSFLESGRLNALLTYPVWTRGRSLDPD